jgi:hypothetical protein
MLRTVQTVFAGAMSPRRKVLSSCILTSASPMMLTAADPSGSSNGQLAAILQQGTGSKFTTLSVA